MMHTDTITVKFGGSSLADSSQFEKVADIVKKDPRRRVVVVSAPGKRFKTDTKVTDMLYECFEAAVSGRDWTNLLAKIKKRYVDIIEGLDLILSIDEEFNIIAAHLQNRPEKEYMASRGEYLNGKLMAAYLGFPFIDAADAILFSEEGRLQEEETYDKLAELLSSNAGSAVIPGFYGADANGHVHTFSRGGSDVTGAIAARAANAILYENWTDVSGMLFADPRIVDAPDVIRVITYKELRELSYMGASVLHEDAVFPVRKAGIPINIRNTNRPSDPGTMIRKSRMPGEEYKTVTGIAGRKGFIGIQVEKSMMNAEIGFGAELLQILSEYGVSFEHCPTGIDTISVVVHKEQFAPYETEIMNEIRNRLQPDELYLEDNLAMIAVVGCGMVAAKGIAARIFKSIAEADINIKMIDQGSSEMNVIVGVDDSHYEEALRALAAEFR